MRVVPLAEVCARATGRRVAVGEFDGVHLGHRAVIVGPDGPADTVLTFDPHPQAVVHPESAPPLLCDLQTKARLVADLGVRELVVIGFDEHFARQSPRAFIDDVLIGRLGATEVSVGENFRFGHRARGDAALLGAQAAFSTRVVALVEVEGEIISSSHIRGLIAAGEVDRAARFLGAPFSVSGEVVSGDHRGRELGFPTANLVPADGHVHPGHGIYACRAILDDDGAQPPAGRCAAVNVGVRPTFATGRGLLIEAHLLDFDGDLYGRRLRLDFLARLRGERRFETTGALIERMGRDVDDARAGCQSSATFARR